ncbi:F-box/kelch-repeat protein At5g39560 isoform X2 [Capsella rubella]|nr:F-box/kelch-repeat protein At5g39560 isoform X2 [Capsella rubella]
MTSEVEQPPQSDKKSLSSQPLVSLLSLPDELVEQILARVPRWDYPNLSLVCKRFHTLISSPQLYTTRFNLGTTEPCLYFYVRSCCKDTSLQWFTLSLKPQETCDGEILNDYSLIPIPCYPHPLRLSLKSTVAVGSDIYVIGGLGELTSSIRIFNCRSNTWRDGPNMTAARKYPCAVLIDKKIYVMGGCDVDNWFEVLDIKTQTWRALPSPGAGYELCNININVNPDAFEGKLYVASYENDYTYEPKDGIWKVVREESSWIELLYSCVIDNVMYSYRFPEHIKWYDSEGRVWREIKGLERLCSGTKQIHNSGGKLVAMWTQVPGKDSENRKSYVWCAKIALEKCHENEIWGKTEWLNIVLEIPESYIFSKCVAVSV